MNRYAKKGFYDWQESIPIFLSPQKKFMTLSVPLL